MAKIKVWTLSSLVAAAMNESDGKRYVQLGRGKQKSALLCQASFVGEGIIVHFSEIEHPETGTSNLTPAEAEAALKTRQKAFAPKASQVKKDAKKAEKKAAEQLQAAAKAARKIAKRNRKEQPAHA